MPKHPTALVYLRVSTGEQERTGVGLAFQRATCAQYAQAHGLTIGRHYLDVMPGDRDERPQYQALLREVRELRARDEQPVVIVAALDRLGRRLLEAVRCREELKQLGVGLHSVREGGELPDLVANFLSAVAQEEVRRRRERLSAGWRHVVQAGWYAPSATPWGYVRRPATQAERVQGAPSLVLDVCHQEARVVRELFQRAADGQSLRALEQWFGSLPPGITARRMSSLRVRHTLTNPAYVGRVRQDWPLGSDGPPGHWPALIDEATWAVVQAHVGSPHWASRASGSILLTNFLPCPRCGHKTSCAVAGNPSDHFYRCASGRGCPSFVAYRPIVDRMVLAHVLQLVVAFRTEQHANLRGLHQAWSRTCRAPAAGAKSTSGSRARSALARPHAHERLGRAAELLASGDLDLLGYELATAEIQSAVSGAHSRERHMVSSLAAYPLDRLIRSSAVWPTVLRGTDVSGQREILGQLLGSVNVIHQARGKYRVSINWSELGRAVREATRAAAAERRTRVIG